MKYAAQAVPATQAHLWCWQSMGASRVIIPRTLLQGVQLGVQPATPRTIAPQLPAVRFLPYLHSRLESGLKCTIHTAYAPPTSSPDTEVPSCQTTVSTRPGSRAESPWFTAGHHAQHRVENVCTVSCDNLHLVKPLPLRHMAPPGEALPMRHGAVSPRQQKVVILKQAHGCCCCRRCR